MAAKKILLAEDEIFIRELYERVLGKAGFEVISACDGEEAVEKVKQMPDLILLDVMMPKMNGIEVLRHLKNDATVKDIPVILLTNLGTEKIIREAFEIGAHGYMMKMRNDPYKIVEQVQKFCDDPSYKMDLNSLGLEEE